MEAILTFANTHDAIRGESLLLRADLPVKVMPVPGSIRAGCGICLRLPAALRGKGIAVLAGHGVAAGGPYGMVEGFPLLPAPVFTDALGLGTGAVVSLVGCGGKTALLHRLAAENRDRTVLLATTAQIRMPPDEVYDRVLRPGDRPGPGVNLLVDGVSEGKIQSIQPEEIRRSIPEEGLTVLEADGSRGLPLKGWADWEPVVPAYGTATVGLCTLRPVGELCDEGTVHRLERFCALTGAVPGRAVLPEHLAAMIGGAEGMFAKAAGRQMLLINQVESPEEEALAAALAGLLARDYPAPGRTVLAGSVRNGTVKILGGEAP